MIPFEYRTPKNLKEVHATLKEFGADAKLISGGTALVIMMKQRLVRPSCLVSLGSVRGLNGIELKNGGIIWRPGDAPLGRKLIVGAPSITHVGGNLSSCRHLADTQRSDGGRRPRHADPETGSASEFDRFGRNGKSNFRQTAAEWSRSMNFSKVTTKRS